MAVTLQQLTKYLRLTLVFMLSRAQWKSLISFFGDFSATISKTFILAGRLGASLSFYGV